jgi:hypothetical protein
MRKKAFGSKAARRSHGDARLAGRGGSHHRQTKAQRQAGATLQKTAAAEVFNNDVGHVRSPQASALAAS